MSRPALWGNSGTLDYWTALARGEVAGPEERAVNLLRRVCDPYRFSLYCMTGQLPVMGNITKKTYLALKSGGLLELDDGVPVAWWCFSVGPYAPDIPDTDNVVVCRSIVEGEELAFLNTGDRHPRGYHFTKNEVERAVGVADPFVVEAMPREFDDFRPDRVLDTAQLLDLSDIMGKNSNEYEGQGQLQGPFINPELGGQVPVLAADAAQHALEELRALRARLEQPEQVGLDEFNQADAIPRVPELYLNEDGVFEMRDGQPAFAPLVWREQIIPGGPGIDMHDGTAMHCNAVEAQRLYVQYGIVLADEVYRMQREGYSPEVIEYLLGEMLPQQLARGPVDFAGVA
jgi:hypothetical protein